MQKCRSHFYLVAIFCVLFTACAQEPKPAGPKFSGRLFFLSGDRTKGADLEEMTAATNDSANPYQVVTSGILEAAASPDQTKLLYATKDGITLRDFGTGAVKSLIKGESSCLAWAPDGNHFSYKQKSGQTPQLYVSDLEGKAKLILDYPNDANECAQWISADRVVLERFVGAAQKKGNEPLKPNTTTVATVGDSVKLKDMPRKWTIESVCAKSNNGFLRSADQGKLLVAKNIDHFESIDPSPASCSECRFVGYAAQSCVPFFMEQPTSTTTDLFYLNPTNWQKQRPSSINRSFSPSARALIKSSAKLMVIGDGSNLFLVDTESGAIVSLLGKIPEESTTPADQKVPIAWIEK
ncbi:MAG TPA: hypothetical protein VHP99_02295 [Pyrinomonadaceae bacterium]|nr:hypothetical protein [Pyrinomonadaceae bacterium]